MNTYVFGFVSQVRNYEKYNADVFTYYNTPSTKYMTIQNKHNIPVAITAYKVASMMESADLIIFLFEEYNFNYKYDGEWSLAELWYAHTFHSDKIFYTEKLNDIIESLPDDNQFQWFIDDINVYVYAGE